MVLACIPADAPPDAFPPGHAALREPNGLLALGGDLSPARLVAAYRRGIFPWYSEGDPLLWWTPDPRAVLYPEELHVSRSLRRRLRRGEFEVRLDSAFDTVVQACAAPRARQPGTWIDADMARAYGALHRLGLARSVECWQDDELVGGLYGVCLGAVFFGESMFSRRADASKVALAHLCGLGYRLIDCQMPNPHLHGLGARLLARHRFEAELARYIDAPPALLPDHG